MNFRKLLRMGRSNLRKFASTDAFRDPTRVSDTGFRAARRHQGPDDPTRGKAIADGRGATLDT
jgi:hypothetical protein